MTKGTTANAAPLPSLLACVIHKIACADGPGYQTKARFLVHVYFSGQSPTTLFCSITSLAVNSCVMGLGLITCLTEVLYIGPKGTVPSKRCCKHGRVHLWHSTREDSSLTSMLLCAGMGVMVLTSTISDCYPPPGSVDLIVGSGVKA